VTTRDQYNMETRMSRERIDAIMVQLKARGAANSQELADALKLPRVTVMRFLLHLRETGRIEVLEDGQGGRGVGRRAVYGIIGVDPELPVIRRFVPANEWPRGEHAFRSGMLALLFPFADQPGAA
jgi:biotin operon repressor